MATGTFSYNALPTKTVTKRAYKNTKKNCKSSNHDKGNAVSIAITTAIKPYLSIDDQSAQFGSQGIVVKCTAAIFFSTVDYKQLSIRPHLYGLGYPRQPSSELPWPR